MKLFIFTLLIAFIIDQDDYEELIGEKVSEQYCNDVINNLVSIIDEGYIYTDFIKSPKQPENYDDDYIPQVDLIKELNNVNKKDRTFYDFYRDILAILEKTRDGHFQVNAGSTPNGFSLDEHYFCIPFRYKIKEEYDEQNEVTEPYFTIQYDDYCEGEYSNEIYDRIHELEGKKIIKINNMSPPEYLEEIGKKYDVAHSPQCRYIFKYLVMQNLFVSTYPFKKEELVLSIEFEGNELLDIEYKFKRYNFLSEDYKKFFYDEKKKILKGYHPIIDLKKLEYKYKLQKGLISKKITRNVNWDLSSQDDNIKCRVDEENKYNVIYQNSFSPDDFNDYEMIMEQCFEEFYSNDYKIIVIEDLNGGGYTDLCVPFYQYLSPKIPKPTYSAVKSSDTNINEYSKNFQVLNPETCMPFTDYKNLINGEEEQYSGGVIHKRSKIFDSMEVYYKINMENNRKSYLSTGKTKKPTEIILFTEGYSFSCTASLINHLQTHGSAIIVGYNKRPDLEKKYFDASQSNSGVFDYKNSEYTQNLVNLGFKIGITNEEEFNPNDKNNPRTPYEFLVNPVDEVSNIYSLYDDEIYDRFIKEADTIFKNYNDLENGKCNPDNKYLYYETSECDSKLNIDNAHGGYLCGSDGKWDKNNCIAAYCDEGYILNDERNKCIKNYCDEISVVEKSISKIETSEEFTIEPKTAYYFYLEDEGESYYIKSNEDNLMYYYDSDSNKVFIDNNTLVISPEYIYINSFLNSSGNAKFIISNDNSMPSNITNYQYKKKSLASWKIALIIIGLMAALLITTIATIFLRKKNSTFEDHLKQGSAVDIKSRSIK